MKYAETGFRPFYKQFIAVPVTESIRSMVKDDIPEDANYMLAYGYLDHTEGLTLELLVGALKDETDGFYFALEDLPKEKSYKVRMQQLMDENCFGFDDEEGELHNRFQQKLEMLAHYDGDEDLQQMREFTFLDELRDGIYADDIFVLLTRDGYQLEGCWARLEHLDEHCLLGELLNEPNQPFGWHKGEIIGIQLGETEEGRVVASSDMNPIIRVTKRDLEDGSMLKQAMQTLRENYTKDNFSKVLFLLRDSKLVVPCTMTLSEADETHLQDLAMQAEGDPFALVGVTFKSQDDIRFKPDILEANGEKYFPVFSSPDEMGEYGEGMSSLQVGIFQVLEMALNCNVDIEGMVVNAFTEQIKIPRDLFDVFGRIKSNVELCELEEEMKRKN